MTTKIAIISDLHQDFPGHPYNHAPIDGVDVVVVAGDLQEGVGVETLVPYIEAGQRVVYVAGNHEFYNHELAMTRQRIREHAMTAGVDFLDGDAVVINGVRFIGATLWTDFGLYGEAHKALVAMACRRGMNDYACIKRMEVYDEVQRILMPLTTNDVEGMHARDKMAIAAFLRQKFDGPTVVVSHHAPSFMSVPDFYKGDIVSGGYASNLENFILEHNPNLWVHGHTHTKHDYQIGDTRVVCNPRGYRFEAVGFKPLIVEL